VTATVDKIVSETVVKFAETLTIEKDDIVVTE
jgi:hypothetical protein